MSEEDFGFQYPGARKPRRLPKWLRRVIRIIKEAVKIWRDNG
jgi:hypothetical protein